MTEPTAVQAATHPGSVPADGPGPGQVAVPPTGRGGSRSWRARYERWTRPRPDGLPTVRVLLAYPALVVVGLLALVSLGISGTSSGVLHAWFEQGDDPALVALKPQPVRSDEYAVQTVYTLAQHELEFPLRNDAMPGGVDTSLLWEVPYAEWSIAFRPHNLGFFVLPLDNAYALKWWLPGAALAVACSMFLVSLWPRRPGAAGLVATGFFFAPFFQWWYLPQTLWPPAWAFFVMTAVIWMHGLERRAPRWWWGAGVAYVTVTAALGIYAPFLIPCAYVVLAFTVGWTLRTDVSSTLRERALRLVPLAAAGATAGAVVVVFLVTRLETIRGFLGTVYPGQRLTETGSMLHDPEWTVPYLGVFGLALRDGSSYGIRPNSPEASTFVLLGMLLVPVAVWLVVHLRRTRHELDVPIVATLACVMLFAAFLYLPGWDLLAHVLLLDRVTATRAVLGLGMLGIVVVGLLVRSLDTRSIRVPWRVALGAGAVTLVLHALLGLSLRGKPAVLAAAGWWPLIALLLAVAVTLVARRRVLAGGLAFLVVSGLVGGWVNPLYEGVFDLRETRVGQAVERVDAADPPARWVGVGDSMVGAILTETGVGGFNAFQGAPDLGMWSALDPGNRFEIKWNRFANVGWTVDEGKPRIFNPAADQVRVSFRSCASFEQDEVDHVLADRPIDQPCLTLEETVEHPVATYYIYSVVPRP